MEKNKQIFLLRGIRPHRSEKNFEISRKSVTQLSAC